MSGYAEFRRGWGIVVSAAVGIGTSVTTLLSYTTGVFVKPLVDEFGWADHEVLVSYSIVLFGASALSPLIGRLSDRVGARRVAIGSVVGLALSWFLLALTAGSLRVFYVCFAVMAIVGTGTLPVTWTAAIIRSFVQRRGLALGLCMVSTGMFGIGAKFYAYFLITQFGWRIAFAGMGVLLLVVTLPVTVIFFREPRERVGFAAPAAVEERDDAVGLSLAAALRSGRFWILCGVFFLLSLAAGIAANLERFMSANGFTVARAVNIASFYGVGIILARLLTGYFIDRVWAPLVVFCVVLPAALAYLVLGLDSHLTVAIASACVLLVGFGPGAEYDALAYLTSRYFGTRAYSAIYGSIYIAFAVGAGTGPYVFSRLLALQASNQAVLFTFAGMFLCGALLCLTLGRYPTFTGGSASPS